ncbi:YD repeat domain protein [Delftia acidovorans]|nr:YD repeat domain protein [Delftia acidovorans]
MRRYRSHCLCPGWQQHHHPVRRPQSPHQPERGRRNQQHRDQRRSQRQLHLRRQRQPPHAGADKGCRHLHHQLPLERPGPAHPRGPGPRQRCADPGPVPLQRRQPARRKFLSNAGLNKATQGSAATYSPLAYERIQWDGLHARRSFEIRGTDNTQTLHSDTDAAVLAGNTAPWLFNPRNTPTAFKWRVPGGLLSCQLPAFRDMRCADHRLE